MTNCRLLVCVLVPLLVIVSGCSHQYVANSKTFPVTREEIRGLVSSGPVRMVNEQPDDKERLLVEIGGHSYYGNYRQMTETAIQLSKGGLGQQDIVAKDSVARTLKLAVTDVEHIHAMWIFRSVVTLQVETGDGLRITFKGDNSTGGPVYRGLDGAVYKAVRTMLNDERIREYLSK